MRIRSQSRLLLLVSLLFLGACNDAPQITVQRVPKSQSGIEDFRGAKPAQDLPLPTPPPAADVGNFEAPDGWTRGKSSPMFPSDKFLKSFDDQEVALSIMPLPASNGWISNVTRWAGQLKQKKSPEEIEAMTIEVDVDGIAANRIRLDGDSDGDAIIGIMARKGQSAWFIKLMGKQSAVTKAENEFDEYVKTLKIP